ncbi:MAG: methyltransferase domain-containing protein [Deltaproteobacteria bacterium]|nr:methyltransferase domain-containing protein [Deltaproteobacteria bacterium]
MPTPINSCPICESKESSTDSKASFYLNLPESFRVTICNSCEMRWLNPQPTPEEYQAIYSESYFSGHGGTSEFPAPKENYEEDVINTRYVWFEKRLDNIRAIFPEAKSILDIGAGTGDFLHLAQKRGFEVAGLELSEFGCKRAKEKFSLELACIELDNFESEHKFDVVHLSHVFEHLTDPNTSLQKIYSLLKPGGIVIIEVPNQFRSWVDNFVDSLQGRKQQPRSLHSIHHPFFYGIQQLSTVVKKNNFEILHATTHFPERWAGSYKRLLLRAVDWFSDLCGGHGRNIEIIARKPGEIENISHSHLKSKRSSRELLSGSSQAFIVSIIGTICAFVLNIILARFLGVNEYGSYNYVMSWLAIIILIGTIGFDEAALKYTAAYSGLKDWASLKGLRTKGIVTILQASIVLAIATIILSRQLIAPELSLTFLLAALIIPLRTLMMFFQSIVRGLKRIVFARLPEMVIQPLVLCTLVSICFLFTSYEKSASNAMACNVISTAIALFASYIFMTRFFPNETKEVVHTYQTKEWIQTALSLLLVTGMYVILNQFDSIMIGTLRTMSEVGSYAVASKASMFVLFGFQAIGQIAGPMISEGFAKDSKEELQVVYSKITFWSFIVAFPTIILICVGAPWILSIFGGEFKVATIALIILALGQGSNIFVGPVGFLFTMTGYEKTALKIVFISLLFNVIFNVPAIYYYGANGAAVVTALSILLRSGIMHIKAKELLGINSSILYAFREAMGHKA